MNKDEKIRKYMEGELSPDELINFEKEISNSPELKKEIDSFRNILNQFRNLSNYDGGEYYFTNILPRFKEKISKKKQYKAKPSFTFGSVTIIVIALLLIFINLNKDLKTGDEQLTLQQLDNEELNIYLNNFTQDLNSSQLTENILEEDDSVFNKMIADELSLNGNSGDYLVDVTSNDFYNILNELSEEDLEGIYNSLIKEDFN
ncbi:MAG TPA: hypothetical protein VLN45_03045 [Ignavibacteriaceae bacterium]|nr:hypothetical protein [Ignavibacteriaceae bacterium]